jgi:hypothetical protein
MAGKRLEFVFPKWGGFFTKPSQKAHGNIILNFYQYSVYKLTINEFSDTSCLKVNNLMFITEMP